jgi:hypothetical protein
VFDVPLSPEPNEEGHNRLAQPDNETNIPIVEQDQEVGQRNKHKRVDCSEVVHCLDLEVVCVWLQAEWRID